MELQWPLMIFTLFICLGAGTFGVTGLLAGLGRAQEIQIPATAISLVAIIIGGIASFLHLQHWDRIFNGFGHLTSGITQELIGIVIFVVFAVIYLVLARKGKIASWAGWVALVISVALVIVMSLSYAMSARPVWDSPLLWLYYLASAILSGALVISALSSIKKTDDTFIPKIALAAGALTLIALVAYAIFIPSVASSFTSVGNYFDPTHPTKVMADPQGILSGFLTGDQALLFWGGALVLGALIPGVAAFLTFKQKGSTATAITSVAALCAL
ncbi:MAG: dimethyl sulfoxide reductase anchor subunit, partial [Coriobacteriales bacterium]|nr:dimethyl sulfoxide reductase anchor subunit [Coriobacteriales bacterium]